MIEAFLFGLLGSFHCAGMCGPIALVLPLRNDSAKTRISGAVIYNFGRIVTYGILGLLFGTLGQTLVLAGFHKWVSVVIGTVMILTVLFPLVFSNKTFLRGLSSNLTSLVVSSFSGFLKKKSFFSLLILGLLNGLLPCGLVYYAIGTSISAGNYLLGSLGMVLFGLGTLPVMLFISVAGQTISQAFRSKMLKVIPVVVVIVGIILILRGMELGIPYISPSAEKLKIQNKTIVTDTNSHNQQQKKQPETTSGCEHCI